MHKLIVALIGLMVTGMAGAKLPPPTGEASAKATEAKDKAAWTDKVAAYQLCRSQDKVAAYYKKTKGSTVKQATAAPAASIVIPPCQNPGPYIAAQPAVKVGVADAMPVPAAGKPPAAAATKK
jgi:hypothetical protein